ncbi:MAG: glucose/mannose-6-phosphate isomerase [Salibacteraceae bacterium]|jgi:glucose/mannose-6-phosphate isomerase
MKSLIQNFSTHLSDALTIGNRASLMGNTRTFSNVLITGMGGSGIGGAIVSQLATNVRIPIVVNNTYDLPSWVNENTLVIGSTYSGNTEETIRVIEAALAKGAEVAFVTSGGRAGELAKEHGLNQIVLEGGNPPRSQFAYSVVSQMFLLNHYGITSFAIDKEINATIALLNREEENTIAESRIIAENIANTMPIIYCAAGYDGVATRFRQQLNENSKMLCWHNVIPEMNHNELVGWAGGNENMSVVILRNTDDSAKNQQRIEINKNIISGYTKRIYEIWSKGNSKIARSFYHVHFEDWVTMHLSEINKVDVMEIDAINFLKAELAK